MAFQKNWTKKEQAQLLIDLGECLKNGYPMNVAFTLQAGRKQKFFRLKINRMIDRLKAGTMLHEILRDEKFPQDVTSIIYFAEETGGLPEALIENGTMILRRERYVQTLRRLMRYPLFLLWFLTLVLYVVGKFLLPNFIQLYQSLSLKLPAITRMMLYLAAHMATILVITVCFIFAIILCVHLFRRCALLKRISFAAQVPFLKVFIQVHFTYQLAIQLSGLLRSGLTIKQGFDILSQKGASPFLKLESKRIAEKLIQGYSFEASVNGIMYYLPEFQTIIEQGCHQGSFGNALYRYSDELMKQMELRTQWLLSITQPIILIIIGGFVLILFLSILLPVFQMINGL
ncbi:type II secretion system F family protein [Sporolactobacillus shoreicorticis]|uniref:Competence type IV pilus assembly protein ComGB n=1 Tax=Sporolactobacillus shoreicorticis TaxID=1923877 RepID=A0ABW5S6X8_9BACL|nr:competence type IV pilus assembly protein ComGB [Sporolactobacillus shoreicorticis]MCO7126566.1 type II secretion system F family protein [Sporolactobacillus shoreicorticis]